MGARRARARWSLHRLDIPQNVSPESERKLRNTGARITHVPHTSPGVFSRRKMQKILLENMFLARPSPLRRCGVATPTRRRRAPVVTSSNPMVMRSYAVFNGIKVEEFECLSIFDTYQEFVAVQICQDSIELRPLRPVGWDSLFIPRT